jgi:hypothetical protein
MDQIDLQSHIRHRSRPEIVLQEFSKSVTTSWLPIHAAGSSAGRRGAPNRRPQWPLARRIGYGRSVSYLKLLGAKSVGVLCTLWFALQMVEWLIPSFRPTFDILVWFLSLVIIGDVLVWFVVQVRNYPPSN